jgi:hypothetical protein
MLRDILIQLLYLDCIMLSALLIITVLKIIIKDLPIYINPFSWFDISKLLLKSAKINKEVCEYENSSDSNKGAYDVNAFRKRMEKMKEARKDEEELVLDEMGFYTPNQIINDGNFTGCEVIEK